MARLQYGIALTVFLGAGALVGANAHSRTRDTSPPAAEPDFRRMVKDYKTWARVNSGPFRMAPAVSAACATPTAGQASPHGGPDAYIDVYVNAVGRSAMMTEGQVVFPVGTIIVKEKRHTIDTSDPELLTVMLKRTKDYNPDTGDWDFAVLDGKAAAVQAQGKLENCMKCHKATPASDFVFRPYLADHH
jgi:hypothetical protein